MSINISVEKKDVVKKRSELIALQKRTKSSEKKITKSGVSKIPGEGGNKDEAGEKSMKPTTVPKESTTTKKGGYYL